jgi:hypothetical protein
MSCTGFDGSLAIGTAGGTATSAAAFTVVPDSRDASCSINGDKADVSDRSSPYKTYVIAGVDLEITATLSNAEHATLATIRNACLNRTTIMVGLFDGDVASGNEGVVFDAYVFSNDLAQPLSGGQTISVSFAPAADGTNLPDWVTLAV